MWIKQPSLCEDWEPDKDGCVVSKVNRETRYGCTMYKYIASWADHAILICNQLSIFTQVFFPEDTSMLCVNAAIVTWLFAQLQRGYQNSTAHVMKQIKTPYTANERILHNASRYSFCSLCEHYVWERFALNFHPKPACRTPKNALNFWSHRITTIVHMLFNCV